MAEQTKTSEKACAVCGRSLLIGERASQYVSGEGGEVTVCELCKPRAESAGWLPPDQASTVARSGERRRRRRGELLGGLRERAERQLERRRAGEAPADEQDDGDGAESVAAQQPRERAPRERPAPSAPQQAQKSQRSVAGPDLKQSLGAFNASENRRTIAGLTRSLGEPRATVIAVRTASGHPGARLTVAWDLAWYQWEIAPGKRGPEVRQSAKGETVDQLHAADRNWNLRMAEDGTLSKPPRAEP